MSSAVASSHLLSVMPLRYFLSSIFLPSFLIRPNKPIFQRRRGRSPWISPRVPAAAGDRKMGTFSPEQLVAPCLGYKNDGSELQATHVGDVQEQSSDPIGHERKRNDGDQPIRAFSSNELMQKLKRYGVAGVLSYGLLNTVYYLTTFLVVWFYFAPAPGGMGYGAAVQRFFKVMAMLWAGSQVTKIVRAGGALALAPFVDRGLSWFTIKFKFESEGKAFAAIVFLCFGLALLLFFGLTVLSA